MRTSKLRFYLAVFCFIGGMSLVGAITNQTIFAQGPTDPPSQPSNTAQDCAECHVDVVNAWQGSTHATAYQDPVFQDAWQQVNQDTSCLACHTTGFVPRTGEFKTAGVSCEACHGQTPADHPPAAVSVDPGAEVCADCHVTTYSEWQHSLHGEKDIACTTCHNPHPQQLRFETVDLLCTSCHEAAPATYTHETHASQVCSDCHWYQSIPDSEHVLTGNLKPTGHDNIIEPLTCVDCHEALEEGLFDELENAEFMQSPHPLRDAQVQIAELEAEVKTVETQGENAAAARMVQGLVFGAVLGGMIVLVIIRFGKRNGKS